MAYATAEEFERICNIFVPSPRKLSDRAFGRFCNAWEQPRIAPKDRDEAEWLAGYDELTADREQWDKEDEENHSYCEE